MNNSARKLLALTDLERARPGTRGDERRIVDGSPLSASAKRTKKTKATGTRINRIVVGAAPRAAYGVADPRDQVLDTADSNASTARPPGDLHARLQRSQTAPTALRQPRKRTLEPLVRRAPRTEDGRVPQQTPNDHEDTHATAVVPSASRSNQNRLYGEMVESEEVEALCRRLGLAPKDVWRLRKGFNDEDTDHTNTITLSSFFYLIHEEQRALTKSLLRLAGPAMTPKAQRLTFDAYLQCVASFATFTEPELFQFFFQVYCDNAVGAGSIPTTHAMGESDLTKLGEDLQVLRTAFAGNVQIATGNAVAVVNQGAVAEGSLTFADFERFSRQHMVAFYPLLQIQRNVRQAGDLGEAFWIQKTGEKVHVQRLLAYMKSHHGLQPPLPLRDRIVRFVLQRPTPQTRVRALAKQLYTG